ncbi:polyprenyl synthetase family protein [Flagellimonas meridianipacifica]|uniref:Geranylgeranyl diphosphate synthase type II n=1 Tax=Flagellimonas meridianipacifica TaxID=1080225 RepID=A0A2T0MHT2_9FLAO|nr:polyprenyl synthetase family protein [Allomuricauda pacifica]PRX57140.1 geranylgeranyl diphosphate synthase type II [Allomuricauda pacifica]
MTEQKKIGEFRDKVLAHLDARFTTKAPETLYEPISYILGLGGKRMRPVLTLMAVDVFNGKIEDALDAALAIEVFHNFSLVHDDIMDDAPLRRGKVTVHEKWNINTGILSGDAMLIKSYQFFEGYEPDMFKKLVSLFSKTAIEVCEGQQYDVDFEIRNDVAIPEYLKMIEYKTAVLVAASLKMGAIIANASHSDADAIYEFGRSLGIAFQLQDDYLDAFGDPKTFGKQVGGDIIENKKTILYLKALEFASSDDKMELERLFSEKPEDPEAKIKRTKEIFQKTGSVAFLKKEIENYTDSAFESLEKISAPEENKMLLKEFGKQLMDRTI